jgi:uncharacterized protein (TIGR02145 family)
MDFDRGQFIDSRDNHLYKTVKIGGQVWLAENFAFLPYVCAPDSANCGVWIYNFKGSDIIEAKKTTEFKAYGALYSWEMAVKLAPEGWHLPSDKEWGTLEKHIGIRESEINGAIWRGDNDKANRLKTDGDIGLKVVFGGWMTDFGQSNYIGQHANFWCSTEFDEDRAYERLLGLNNGKIGRDKGNKGCGFSVRYVKD